MMSPRSILPPKVGRIVASANLDRLREPGLTYLLVVEAITIFLISPMGESGMVRSWAVDVSLLLMAVLSLVIAGNRFTRILIVTGFAWMLTGTVLKATGSQDGITFLSGILSIIFFVTIVSMVVARKVFSSGPISVHRIQGAIILYLNIALLFGLIGDVILFVSPHAYSGLSPNTKGQLTEMMYFSMTTLTTTGYGDVLPVHPLARSLANFEAVIGQLYPATLMATLVGMHVSHRQQMERQDPSH